MAGVRTTAITSPQTVAVVTSRAADIYLKCICELQVTSYGYSRTKDRRYTCKLKTAAIAELKTVVATGAQTMIVGRLQVTAIVRLQGTVTIR